MKNLNSRIIMQKNLQCVIQKVIYYERSVHFRYFSFYNTSNKTQKVKNYFKFKFQKQEKYENTIGYY